jgi:hypothetical protein
VQEELELKKLTPSPTIRGLRKSQKGMSSLLSLSFLLFFFFSLKEIGKFTIANLVIKENF